MKNYISYERKWIYYRRSCDGIFHYEPEDEGIRKIDYKFEYPNEAIELLNSLNTECSTYISNGGNCASDCENLNRWPILRAKNIRYQVLTFDRKDPL